MGSGGTPHKFSKEKKTRVAIAIVRSWCSAASCCWALLTANYLGNSEISGLSFKFGKRKTNKFGASNWQVILVRNSCVSPG